MRRKDPTSGLRRFSQRVFAVVRKIPKGRTMTYAEVARRAGSARAVRAVGNILSRNTDQKIPCHRVVRSDGRAGGYFGSFTRTNEKRAKLKSEGVRDIR